MQGHIRINEKDNVITALREFEPGDTIEVDGKEIKIVEKIPQFHKLAIAAIPKGEHCYKYGEVIGVALEDIKEGEHVHVHNVESEHGRGDKQ